jgi:hypothetical protein
MLAPAPRWVTARFEPTPLMTPEVRKSRSHAWISSSRKEGAVSASVLPMIEMRWAMGGV